MEFIRKPQPQGLPADTYELGPIPSLEESKAFCRGIARSHYENFVVASVLLPRHLKQHFYNVYAYCRISDDFADETGDTQRATQLLNQWEQELLACYEGKAHHPVFIALRETITEFDIPVAPFADLLKAFKHDQSRTRYQTFDQLLGYCRYSANPVGHLVLYLFGWRDPERQQLSDCICTALQLANHWQDVARDLSELNRVYLPQEDLDRFGYSESDLRAQIYDERFVSLMRFQVERAREMFHRGLRLCGLVEPPLSLEIRLFGYSGLELLRKIEKVRYDVFRQRPTLSKWNRFKILLHCWLTTRGHLPAASKG